MVVHMPAKMPAEQALARSYTTGDGMVRCNVDELSVSHQPDRSVMLTYWLTAEREGLQAERWEFTLPWDDKSFLDVFTSPAPDPERLQQLVYIVRTALEEWWDTKGHNRKSAKMGRRLP
ncbi:hypothetical protein [Streptomyces pinistramenti]|uniref:hypothetical protein n=1 Tax=Streptomyces pinistramenti TaxID=2884812 RepID=UPI001D0826D7|nr:hypothetical protein [Streptomyces pinistramenti]MCB5908197.1 hypothetical protein [Streptomyces pinistramenti]